jgi:hypothetical protein
MFKTAHGSDRSSGFLAALVVLTVTLGGFVIAADPPLPGTWEGTFYAAHFDSTEGTEVTVFYGLIEVVTGTEYRLVFESQPPGAQSTGYPISVTGTLLGDTITVSDYELGPPPVQKSLDDKPMYSVAVVLVDFDTRPLGCTADGVHDLMFSDPLNQSLDDLYTETSYGQTGFYGDVHGPYLVTYWEDPLGSCSTSLRNWRDAANAAAADDGVLLSAYDIVVYVYPNPNICTRDYGYGGIASIFGSYVDIFHCGVEGIYSHEIGHLFWLNHAWQILDGGGQGYDFSCIMGGVWKDGAWVPDRGMNAPHKIDMGWISEEQLVQTSECGSFELSALELPPSLATGPQIIEVPKPDGGSYYLSYRAGIGFDANLLAEYRDKVSVHTWNGGIYQPTYLHEALDAGESFEDDTNDFVFQVYERDADSAIVDVLIDPGVNRTTASIEPPLAQGGVDVYRTFVLTVNNEDCLEHWRVTKYEIIGAVPAELNVTMSPTSLTLAPGESGEVIIEAAGREFAGEGTHSLHFLADGGKTLHTATAEADYVIDYYPPTIPQNLSAADGLSPVEVSWSASTDSGAGVSHYVLYRNGIFLTEVESTYYNDSDVSPGYTYTYRVKAVDRVGRESQLSDPDSAFVTSRKITKIPHQPPSGDE